MLIDALRASWARSRSGEGGEYLNVLGLISGTLCHSVFNKPQAPVACTLSSNRRQAVRPLWSRLACKTIGLGAHSSSRVNLKMSLACISRSAAVRNRKSTKGFLAPHSKGLWCGSASVKIRLRLWPWYNTHALSLSNFWLQTAEPGCLNSPSWRADYSSMSVELSFRALSMSVSCVVFGKLRRSLLPC